MKRLLFALAALLGCAHVMTPEEQAQEFLFHSNSDSYSVQATPTGLSGPYHSVAIFKEGMRGTVSGRPLDLELANNEAKGILGSSQVDLHWIADPNGIRMRGLYAGVLSDLLISPKQLKGQAGPCFYDMIAVGAEYHGNTNCQPQGPSRTALRLPAGFNDHPDLVKATALVIILGHIVDASANNNMAAPAGFDPGDR